MNPAPNIAIHSGPGARFGWRKSDAVQGEIGEWYAASDLATEKQVIAELNQAAMDDATYLPTGFFLMYQA